MAKERNVTFRRIRGRIVPIRLNKQQKKGQTRDLIQALVGGVAIGVGSDLAKKRKVRAPQIKALKFSPGSKVIDFRKAAFKQRVNAGINKTNKFVKKSLTPLKVHRAGRFIKGLGVGLIGFAVVRTIAREETITARKRGK